MVAGGIGSCDDLCGPTCCTVAERETFRDGLAVIEHRCLTFSRPGGSCFLRSGLVSITLISFWLMCRSPLKICTVRLALPEFGKNNSKKDW